MTDATLHKGDIVRWMRSGGEGHPEPWIGWVVELQSESDALVSFAGFGEDTVPVEDLEVLSDHELTMMLDIVQQQRKEAARKGLAFLVSELERQEVAIKSKLGLS